MNIRICIPALAAVCLSGCGADTVGQDSSSSSSSSSSTSSGYTSSSSGGPITPNVQVLATLPVQRDLWESYGILEYKVTLQAQYGNSLPIDVVLHVNEGELVDVQPNDSEYGEPIDPEHFAIMTIAEAFEQIESIASQGAYQLNVSYDETYGFPTQFYSDYRQDWYDDQDEWSFTGLEVLR